VYRLERIQDVLELGFEEMLDQGGAVLVEWGDAVEALLPPERLRVELSVPGPGDARRLVLAGAGQPWARRWERLERLAQLRGRVA
jgi:tRNA threonylcarbamoyladenosine biosynthesis protein TsaE